MISALAACGGDDTPDHPPVPDHPDHLYTDGGPRTGVATTSGSFVPCDIASVLARNCKTCHGAPALPSTVSLVTWGDLSRTAKSGLPMSAEIGIRVHATGPTQMPPSITLAAPDLATIDAWEGAGSPAAASSCR
jgi:hypothetical protein